MHIYTLICPFRKHVFVCLFMHMIDIIDHNCMPPQHALYSSRPARRSRWASLPGFVKMP